MSEFDLSKLKAFRGVKPYIEGQQYEELLSKLTSREATKLKQLEFGLEAEDEFLLLSLLTGKCSSIQKVEETKFKTTGDSIPCDFIATYRKEIGTPIEDHENSTTMLVEVKRRRDEIWSISKRDFDRRERFAMLNHLPLFYAVKFEVPGLSAWSMFPSGFVKACNYKLHFTQCWNSVFDLVLGGYNMYVRNAVVSQSFSKSVEREPILRNHEYGFLSELTVSFDANEFTFHGQDPVTLFFSCIQVDRLERSTEGSRVVVNEHVPDQLVASYHLLLRIARLQENRGMGTSPTLLLSELKNGMFLPDHKMVNYISNRLEECGLIVSFIWNPDLKIPDEIPSRRLPQALRVELEIKRKPHVEEN
jgi:hypothetical protein